MQEKYILVLDQGTTSSRAVIFDKRGNVVQLAQKELTQYYPHKGWVEHDAMEIWGSQSGVAREVLETAGIRPSEIVAIGITNQRETTVVWDKHTGKPVYNAIVWQCRRTSNYCEELSKKGLSEYVKEHTGLVIDAYFSATKIKWILDNVEGARERAENGDLLFGNIDSWLVWNLTRGKKHITDYSNASRTMLFDIEKLEWNQRLLDELNIPRSMMPEVVSSSAVHGYTEEHTFGGANIPIAGIAGDQHAALFGQACFAEGMAKNTYGTGCFMLMNTGDKKINSNNGLLTTIAWEIDGMVEYALEGSVFIAGALIQWLRDELKLINDARDSEYFASKVDDSNGVYIVPAFVGLGAPHWDMYARGAILGLTRESNRDHIIRAALEAIAYQTKDVILAMKEDSGIALKELRVDGGASANDFLMQFQADILGSNAVRPKNVESTAFGAACLAGLATKFWKDKKEVESLLEVDREFIPAMSDDELQRRYDGWIKAVRRTEHWEDR